MADKFSLIVDDREWDGWESISVNQSLTDISGSFNVSVSSKFTTNWAENYGIYLGAKFQVKINDVSLVNGHIDEIPISYSKDNYSIGYAGRDKAADLVDCCHDTKKYKSEYQNLTPFAIIKKLCDPFDIEVIVDGTELYNEIYNTAKPIAKTVIDTGAPVYDAIEKLCQVYAILPYSNGDGALWLGRASKKYAKDKLEGGVNILAASSAQNNADRFRTYCAKASTSNAGGTVDKLTSGDLIDWTIGRHRPLIIVDGDLKTIDDCQKKAAWEARVREGKSRKLDVTVQGWTQTDGTPWPLNRLVPVYDPYLGLDEDFLIAGLSFSLDGSSGSMTRITLVKPDTFELKKKKDIVKGKDSAYWDRIRSKTKGDKIGESVPQDNTKKKKPYVDRWLK